MKEKYELNDIYKGGRRKFSSYVRQDKGVRGSVSPLS